ncbi:hypothetical protein FJ970_08155 [Mesorhizobium sp. B2-1-8]|uniref:hypothetical protein n=1 Tax=Mesorhizobium sp. B2-1-8 TaxID=2589967 RepID=UPI0011263C5B|nr:hypothetical protein [Mesorhizobium sp. B2-1-8]UCI20919.1 hypothetical protein FJ970_08155 [Mesorhizobium sp. B2-1-8]
MATAILLTVLIPLCFYWVRYGLPILALALKSGIMKARGRIYLQDMDPLQFWVGVMFHLMGVVLPPVCLAALLLG